MLLIGSRLNPWICRRVSEWVVALGAKTLSPTRIISQLSPQHNNTVGNFRIRISRYQHLYHGHRKSPWQHPAPRPSGAATEQSQILSLSSREPNSPLKRHCFGNPEPSPPRPRPPISTRLQLELVTPLNRPRTIPQTPSIATMSLRSRTYCESTRRSQQFLVTRLHRSNGNRSSSTVR